jgi:hypothetical protein
MPTPITTGRPSVARAPARTKRQKRPPHPAAKRDPNPTRARQAEARHDAASKAVAAAFARIVAERYPGTTWLPLERSRSNDSFVVPAGKILRLLPGPADMNTDARIGNPTAPAAHERAPYEHSPNPGA